VVVAAAVGAETDMATGVQWLVHIIILITRTTTIHTPLEAVVAAVAVAVVIPSVSARAIGTAHRAISRTLLLVLSASSVGRVHL